MYGLTRMADCGFFVMDACSSSLESRAELRLNRGRVRWENKQESSVLLKDVRIRCFQ
jgi:hypothetical protein